MSARRSSRTRRSPSSPSCTSGSAPRRKELLAARRERAAELARGGTLDFLPETREIRDGRLVRRRAARRLPRPARRDHRADRPQARHQRPQLGREGLHGRLRGRELPHLGQPGRRAREPRRRDRGHDRVHELGGQGVPARRRDRDAARPPARLAPAREAPDDGRRGGLGLAHRLRPARLPRRSPAGRAGPRRLLLPAQAGAPPRGAAVERRVLVRRGPLRARARARCARPS